LREAYNGARQVAYVLAGAIKNMNSAQAFHYTFGNMTFCSGDCNGIVLGGYYGISSGSTIALNLSHLSGQGVAHELGHSFETRVYDSLGSNVTGAPVNMLAAIGNAIKDLRGRHVSGYDPNAGTFVRTMEGYGDCGLICSYHPLDMMPEGDSAGEDYADMFMNWAYGSFANDTNGAGSARYNWINDNIAHWIGHIS
jgi:hypothetical protein